MKPADRIKRLINKSSVRTSGEADKNILGDSLEHLENKQKQLPGTRSSVWRITMKSRITKLAAAAVVLIAAGFAAGRLSAPRPPDIEGLRSALETSLKSSLEPAIRQNLLGEMDRKWEMALASNRVQFKAEVKQILVDLIRAIDAAKTQDRRWIMEALDQIELSRIKDKNQFRNGLEALAIGTDNKLERTKRDIAKLLVYSRPGGFVPEELKSLITSSERSKK